MGLGGIVSAPFKAVGGALGLTGGSLPQAQSVDYDDQTKGLLQKQIARGDQTANDIVNRNTAGMDEKAQAFNAASQVSKPVKNEALGLNPLANDLDQALQNRAARQYGDSSSLLKSKMQLGANNEVIRNEAQAAQAQNALTKQKLQAYSAKLKNDAARKQARSQMFGSILGLGGTLGGAYLGGMMGPAGGAAGAAAGGKIGSGIGSGLGG